MKHSILSSLAQVKGPEQARDSDEAQTQRAQANKQRAIAALPRGNLSLSFLLPGVIVLMERIENEVRGYQTQEARAWLRALAMERKIEFLGTKARGLNFIAWEIGIGAIAARLKGEVRSSRANVRGNRVWVLRAGLPLFFFSNWSPSFKRRKASYMLHTCWR